MINSVQRVLVYYFAFPHYRRAILDAMMEMATREDDLEIEFAAGVRSKANIEVLSRTQFPAMRELSTISVGAVQWQRGIFRHASSSRFKAVVLGPSIASPTTLAILVLRRVCGRRSYLWGQCGRPGDRSLRRYAQELLNRLADAVLVYGEAEARAATELGLDPRRVRVVHNANEQNTEAASQGDRLYEEVRCKFEAAKEDGCLSLLYLGRLVPEKRVACVLDASRILLHDFPKLEMHVVGGGSELEILRARYPDSHVFFHGAVYSREELQRHMQRATMVCSPYHMGLLAIDALRAGIPVLLPNNPMNASEVEALTPDVNARVFRAGDAEAIAQSAREFIDVFPSVDREVFVRVRREQLSIWSPAAVARNILEAVL